MPQHSQAQPRKQDYSEWERHLDRQVQRGLGVAIADMPPLDFERWYHDGLTPGEAASLVLEELALAY